jgi:nitroreductase/NAD-dependent dihydropyrimidine dehydrogenase PreA subunit
VEEIELELLKVDESRCKKDGICVNECPSTIIRLREKGGYPTVAPEDEQACVLCGHCVAVCPHGALTHSHVPLEKCPPIKKDLLIGHEQVGQFLRSRRSVRQFKDKPVERDKILGLIETARYAPTSGNSQLIQWLVFTEKNLIKELSRLTSDYLRVLLRRVPQSALPPYLPRVLSACDAGHDAVLRDAPVVIVASAPQKAAFGMVDLIIAMSYLDLAAPSVGLGTCWAGLLQRGLLDWPPLKEVVGLPAGNTSHFPMMVGYPKNNYYRLPERKPPKIDWR